MKSKCRTGITLFIINFSIKDNTTCYVRADPLQIRTFSSALLSLRTQVEYLLLIFKQKSVFCWLSQSITDNLCTKDWAGKKVTILYSTQQWLKFQKLFNLLTCILLDYVAHEITKRILKNINFENMTAVFLLVGQNSPRCEISLICCWNNDSRKKKMTLGYVMVSKNDQNII